MSEETELRDRIAKVLDQNFNPDQYPIMAAVFRDYAQAIIDEFGLTTEERLTEFGIDDPGYQERVVGKWEET